MNQWLKRAQELAPSTLRDARVNTGLTSSEVMELYLLLSVADSLERLASSYETQLSKEAIHAKP